MKPFTDVKQSKRLVCLRAQNRVNHFGCLPSDSQFFLPVGFCAKHIYVRLLHLLNPLKLKLKILILSCRIPMLLSPSLKWHRYRTSHLPMYRGVQQQQVKRFLKGAHQTLLTMLQLRWRQLNAPLVICALGLAREAEEVDVAGKDVM